MTIQNIKNCLGKPYYENESVILYHQDCLEGMASLPKGVFDLTVTSPPYNIGKEYEQSLSIDEYINWCVSWIDEIYRTTQDSGSFWLNLGYVSLENQAKAIPIPYLLWDKIPFYMIQEVVWNYGAGVAGRKFYSPRNEKFLWYVKDENNYTFNLDDVRDPSVKYPNQKKNGKLKCNPLGKNPTDVWQIPKVTSGANRSSIERTKHPCQFPEALIDRIVKASSDKHQLILDPFMGSGSTAVTALKNNRKCVGFELNETYLEIAARRIDKAILEGFSEQMSLIS